MSARILIVEDEPHVLQGLIDLLQAKGYAVLAATTGPEALIKATEGKPDLILLDVMIPGLSGFDVLKTLRSQGETIPIMMLTAKGAEIDKVLGFELGVDDYVTKPFSLLELLGRIQALLRRGITPARVSAMRIGALEIDFERLAAHRAGECVDLPHRAIDLLRVLAMADGRVVSRDRLIDEVWGRDQVVNTRTIDNLVVKLRQAIESDPNQPVFLHTVRGRGYRLACCPEEDAAGPTLVE